MENIMKMSKWGNSSQNCAVILIMKNKGTIISKKMALDTLQTEHNGKKERKEHKTKI